MLPTYLRWHRRGWIVPAAEPKITRDEGTTAVVDGQQAFGHYTSTLAMELAIAKARAHGVGFVTCRNSNHYGAAANYSMMALAHDMIGLSLTNSGPAVVPTYGRQAMLGTNPISFAAPAGRHFPFVLDMATSTVAIGKLSVALRWGKPIPPGWALDEEGQPTTDPTVAYETRHLTPLGATRELGGSQGLRPRRHGRHPVRRARRRGVRGRSPARPRPDPAPTSGTSSARSTSPASVTWMPSRPTWTTSCRR